MRALATRRRRGPARRQVAFASLALAGLALVSCGGSNHDPNTGGSSARPSPTSPGSAAAPSGAAPATPAGLRRVWSTHLDGAVYAAPLVRSGTVYVATEGGSVYAFDAAGKQLWRTHLANPVHLSDLASRGAPCGNIDPLGITGRPVYDPKSNKLFAVAETLSSTGAVQHVLFALNPNTGAVLARQLVVPPRGNPAAHQQRGALAVTGGRVLVPFGGLYGDCGDYIGSIVGVPTSMTSARVSYATPTARDGGFWAPPGVTVLPDGSVLATSGNGAATGGRYDGSDAVVHLTADLQLIDRFTPPTWAADNANDLDLGSMGPVVTANGFVVQSGKRGVTYVVRLGQLARGAVSSATGCAAYGGAAVTEGPVYLPCSNGIQRVDISANGSINVRWQASGIPGSPVVYGQSLLATAASQGELYLLDTDTGRVRASLAVGSLSRFATPALDSGRAYLGTLSGIVAVDVQ